VRTYLINLDCDTARLAWMHDQLAALGIPYERVPAVYGEELSPLDAAYHQDPKRVGLSPAEIGCLLSHLKLWTRIAAGEGKAALVLEDDVHFKPDFADMLASIEIDGADPVVHKLETFLAVVTAFLSPRQCIGRRRGLDLLTLHGGAAAYVISRAGAKALAEAGDRFTQSADIELFDFGRRAVQGLRVVQWIPAPCVQDMLLPFASGRKAFASRIHDHRKDARDGVMFAQAKPIEFAKKLLRPAYTFAHALALAPSGHTRVMVPFG
jgi:glycosyl transferase, family 25